MSRSQSDVNRTTRAFLWLSAGGCVLFLAWAALFSLDIVSEAIGEVIPRTKVKRVQHLEGGIVRDIQVREGDTVEKGQVLVVLQDVASDSTLEEIEVRVNALRVEALRLEAEDQGLDEPPFPEALEREAPQLVARARDLFQSRRTSLENELAAQDEKITQREQDVQEIEARLRNMRKTLAFLREKISISEELLKDQLTTRYKHLGLLTDATNLKSDIEENTAALNRAHSALVAARDKREQILNAYQQDVRQQIKEVQQELGEFQQRQRKFKDSRDRTVIRSPEDGVVRTLYIVNEGEVVQPGKTILDIVPAGDRLVVEAHLPVRDIGYVAQGQRAVVKLASADARRFGTLEGEVIHVSPDAITLQTGETFYRVRVATQRDYFEHGDERYRLYPGMRVIVGIHTGTRTVLEYILDPFLTNLDRGLHER